MGNRLAQETSPYLLEHADNPVDWYPWGPEALAKAPNAKATLPHAPRRDLPQVPDDCRPR